jgi:hypothetical protein
VTTQSSFCTQVKGDVVVTACLLYDAEVIENRYGEQLHWAAGKLKDVSGIDSAGWKMLKIATALKIMFDPLETTDHDMQVMFCKCLTFYESLSFM